MSPTYNQIAAVRGLTLGPVTYSYATANTAWQRRELLRRTSAERRRRYMRTVLGVAIKPCERRNLAAPNRMTAVPPEQVVALIEPWLDQVVATRTALKCRGTKLERETGPRPRVPISWSNSSIACLEWPFQSCYPTSFKKASTRCMSNAAALSS
jgi:hypothetical protein